MGKHCVPNHSTAATRNVLPQTLHQKQTPFSATLSSEWGYNTLSFPNGTLSPMWYIAFDRRHMGQFLKGIGCHLGCRPVFLQDSLEIKHKWKEFSGWFHFSRSQDMTGIQPDSSETARETSLSLSFFLYLINLLLFSARFSEKEKKWVYKCIWAVACGMPVSSHSLCL